ncbi:MAG: VTT domain-containing protein [Dehalococcoidia bacterium]|nr:MAG: VTT domain-containing protein [Dehalococcoidia bacterium]
MSLPNEKSTAVKRRRWAAWRLEYSLLIFVVALMTVFAFAFFYFQVEVTRLKDYGYVGVFIISFIGAASMILPTPALASVVGGGAILNSYLGIPTFVWVGIVAGLGEALGEFTGYAAGYGGRIVIQQRPEYKRVQGWMERHGVITMFVMSVIPNPLFDVAGAMAGVVRMPLGRFFLAVLAGKVIKDMYIAAVGDFGIGVLGGLLS